MRTPLLRRVKRDLRSNFIRYFSIFIIIFSSIAISSGFFLVQKSVLHVYDHSLIEGRVEDGQIRLAFPINKKGQSTLEQMTSESENNFSKEIEYKPNKTIRAFINRQSINLPAYHEGREPQNAYEISLNRLFVKKNHLRVGDRLTLRGHTYKLVGIMTLPDYSTMLKARGDLMMSNTNFGVALMTQEGFDALGEKSLSYTYSYRLADSLSDKESLDHLTKLTESLIKDGNMVTDGFIRALNTNISYFRDDMGGDVPMMYTLLVMIFIVMAFLFTVIIKSTIEEEAPVIGTLMALGYRRHELIHYYMRLPILITIVAAVLGNVLGYTVFKNLFLSLYYNNFSLFPVKIKLDPQAFLLSSLLPLALIASINYLMLRRKLRFSPLNFLRKDLKKFGKKTAVRLPAFSFLSRFRLRVMLQNKVLFLVMFVGIILANLLLLYGIAALPILNGYASELGQSMPARYEHHLRGPIDENHKGKFTFYNMQSRENFGGRQLMITMYGYENEMPYFKEYPVKMDALEAYASKGVIEKMKTRVGNSIDLYDKFLGRTVHIKLIGQTDDANLTLYMHRSTLNHLMGKETQFYNGIFSDKRLDIDERMLVRVLDSKDMTEIGQNLTLFARKIIPTVLAVSIAIFLVIVIVLSHVILQRSALSICYLRVFGYRRKEISKVYLGATDLALIVFEIISIPIGAYLLKVTMRLAMAKFNAYVHPVAPWPYYLIPAAVGIILYQLSKFIQVRKIERADLSEALKENIG